jgi:hypothetical protein
VQSTHFTTTVFIRRIVMQEKDKKDQIELLIDELEERIAPGRLNCGFGGGSHGGSRGGSRGGSKHGSKGGSKHGSKHGTKGGSKHGTKGGSKHGSNKHGSRRGGRCR